MGINTAAFTASASTVGTTEKSLTNNSTSIATQTTAGYYQVFIDAANVAAGDEFEVALLEKVISGGSQRRVVIGRFLGGQPEIFISPAFLLGVGWDFSLKKIAGTDRAFDWSVRQVT